MRIIITGGAGFIGRALAASLAATGREVIVLSRRPSRAAGLLPGVRAEAWDGKTADGWGALAEGAEAIVNLAGENLGGGLWTGVRKRRILQSRVDAGRAVAEAVRAAKTKPRVVAQASAVGFYGPRGDEEITEDSPAGEDFLAGVCKAWENSTAPVEALGVRRVVIRSSLVLANQGGVFPFFLLPVRLFVGGPLGGGRQWVPCIHLSDEIGAIRFLIENESASGPINLCTQAPLTNAEFMRLLGRLTRRPYWLPAPAFALRLVLGQMSTLVLDGQRQTPKRLIELGYPFRFPTPEAALKALLS